METQKKVAIFLFFFTIDRKRFAIKQSFRGKLANK